MHSVSSFPSRRQTRNWHMRLTAAAAHHIYKSTWSAISLLCVVHSGFGIWWRTESLLLRWKSSLYQEHAATRINIEWSQSSRDTEKRKKECQLMSERCSVQTTVFISAICHTRLGTVCFFPLPIWHCQQIIDFPLSSLRAEIYFDLYCFDHISFSWSFSLFFIKLCPINFRWKTTTSLSAPNLSCVSRKMIFSIFQTYSPIKLSSTLKKPFAFETFTNFPIIIVIRSFPCLPAMRTMRSRKIVFLANTRLDLGFHVIQFSSSRRTELQSFIFIIIGIVSSHLISISD